MAPVAVSFLATASAHSVWQARPARRASSNNEATFLFTTVLLELGLFLGIPSSGHDKRVRLDWLHTGAWLPPR